MTPFIAPQVLEEPLVTPPRFGDEDGSGGTEGDGADEGGDAEGAGKGTALAGDDGDGVADEGSEGDQTGTASRDAKSGEEAEGTEGDDAAKAEEVPEDGVYEFELPEGVELGDEDKAYWSGQFKEMGLSRKQAQALIEAQSQKVIDTAAAQTAQLDKQQSDHLAAAKADPEIGGDKYDEHVALAKSGLEAMGGTALRDLILVTGNGNNPKSFANCPVSGARSQMTNSPEAMARLSLSRPEKHGTTTRRRVLR